jgi:hypothetical protein
MKIKAALAPNIVRIIADSLSVQVITPEYPAEFVRFLARGCGGGYERFH